MLDLTIIILTKNEEIHLGRVLENVAGFSSRIIVVDSFSSDSTKNVARDFGVDFYEHQFVNQAVQFQWALDNCNVSTKWIMRLDADEILGTDLKDRLKDIIPLLDDSVVGINLNRKHIFWNRWIRFGGRYPLYMVRIWRRGHGRVENRWMDEHVLTWGGKVIKVEGDFRDCNLNDLSFFTDKHNKYATREALDVLLKKYSLTQNDDAMSSKSVSAQAVLKRWIKERIYNRLPFFLSSFSYFLWRYFFRLGFLDGGAGLVYHLLQGFWYRFLVGARVRELELVLSTCSSPEEMRKALSKATGFKLG